MPKQTLDDDIRGMVWLFPVGDERQARVREIANRVFKLERFAATVAAVVETTGTRDIRHDIRCLLEDLKP